MPQQVIVERKALAAYTSKLSSRVYSSHEELRVLLNKPREVLRSLSCNVVTNLKHKNGKIFFIL